MTNVSKALLYYYDSVSKKYKLISDMENTDIKKFIPKVEIYWFDELTNSYKPLVTDGTLPLSGDGGSFDPSLLLDYAKKDYVNDSIGILETYIGSVYATKDYVVTEIEKLNLEEMFLKKSDALALYASNSSIGDLSQLTTTDKTNLVNAINEVKISGTGGEGVDLSGYATKNELDNKVDKIAGKTLSTNDYTTAEQNKLKGIAEGATKTIVEDSVTSTSTTNAVSAKSVKQTYDLANSKANTDVATTTNKGLMSNADKSKLDGIAEGANNYNLPVATSSILGGVKVAVNTGIELTSDGTISATTLKKSMDDHSVDSLSHVFYCGSSSGVNAKVINNTAVESYIEGLQVKFKNSDANTGNVTVNVNGLGTKKLLSFTGTELKSAELRANMVYNIVYNGTDFFLASGGVNTGDATALSNDILSGKTAYVDGQKITGAMTDNGAVTEYIPTNDTITIPEGYHNGKGKVVHQVNTKGAETFVPKTKDQQILVGQYLTGTQTIKGDANLISANILSGKSIFGVSGTVEAPIKPMPNSLLENFYDSNAGLSLSSVDSDGNFYIVNGSAGIFYKYNNNGTLISTYTKLESSTIRKALGYTKYGFCFINVNGNFTVADSNQNILYSVYSSTWNGVSPFNYLNSAWFLGGTTVVYPVDDYGTNFCSHTGFKTRNFSIGRVQDSEAFLNSTNELIYFRDSNRDSLYKTDFTNIKIISVKGMFASYNL